MLQASMPLRDSVERRLLHAIPPTVGNKGVHWHCSW